MKNFVILALTAILTGAVAQNALAGQGSTIQANAPASAGLTPINLPNEMPFLAKLSTELNGRQCKPGDPEEAEVKQDVKRGHDLLLKKGSMLVGHVASVQPSSKQLEVAIMFDSVRLKGDQQFSLHAVIQALAPEGDLDSNHSLSDYTGTGMQTATRRAGVSGHSTTTIGSVNALTTDSKGVYDLAGLQLADQITNGTHSSVVISSTGDIKLKKGTQLVLRTVN